MPVAAVLRLRLSEQLHIHNYADDGGSLWLIRPDSIVNAGIPCACKKHDPELISVLAEIYCSKGFGVALTRFVESENTNLFAQTQAIRILLFIAEAVRPGWLFTGFDRFKSLISLMTAAL